MGRLTCQAAHVDASYASFTGNCPPFLHWLAFTLLLFAHQLAVMTDETSATE